MREGALMNVEQTRLNAKMPTSIGQGSATNLAGKPAKRNSAQMIIPIDHASSVTAYSYTARGGPCRPSRLALGRQRA
jgi:hypothetical protein